MTGRRRKSKSGREREPGVDVCKLKKKSGTEGTL